MPRSQTAVFTKKDLRQKTLLFTGTFEQDAEWPDEAIGFRIPHYGDSGSGALYEEADGTLRIIGVKSNGSSTAYYGSHHEYTYIGDYHSSWI